jgi:hypothetical protein
MRNTLREVASEFRQERDEVNVRYDEFNTLDTLI